MMWLSSKIPEGHRSSWLKPILGDIPGMTPLAPRMITPIHLKKMMPCSFRSDSIRESLSSSSQGNRRRIHKWEDPLHLQRRVVVIFSS